MAARGPRGWVRPDACILDELCERIVRGGVDASGLTLEVEGGHVWLEGEVALREERRLVLDLAERTLGVKGVFAEVRGARGRGGGTRAAGRGRADVALTVTPRPAGPPSTR